MNVLVREEQSLADRVNDPVAWIFHVSDLQTEGVSRTIEGDPEVLKSEVLRARRLVKHALGDTESRNITVGQDKTSDAG